MPPDPVSPLPGHGSLLVWPPSAPRFLGLAAVTLGLFAAYAGIYFTVAWSRAAPGEGDFFGLWSVGRFLTEHPAGEVYNPAALQAAQVALGMPPQYTYP